MRPGQLQGGFAPLEAHVGCRGAGRVVGCPQRASGVGVGLCAPGMTPSFGWELTIKIPSSRKHEGKWGSHTGSINTRLWVPLNSPACTGAFLPRGWIVRSTLSSCVGRLSLCGMRIMLFLGHWCFPGPGWQVRCPRAPRGCVGAGLGESQLLCRQ